MQRILNTNYNWRAIMAEEYINEGYRREIRQGGIDGYTNLRIAPALAYIMGESVLDLGCGLGTAANHINT